MSVFISDVYRNKIDHPKCALHWNFIIDACRKYMVEAKLGWTSYIGEYLAYNSYWIDIAK